MICKVMYTHDPKKPWVVEKYEGKTLVSTKYYKKVFFTYATPKKPIESDGAVLIVNYGMYVESGNGDVLSLEY